MFAKNFFKNIFAIKLSLTNQKLAKLKKSAISRLINLLYIVHHVTFEKKTQVMIAQVTVSNSQIIIMVLIIVINNFIHFL